MNSEQAKGGRLRPGLVSVTFRSLEPDKIIELCRQHSLAGIEWGGDIHVPPGDEQHARRIGEATRAAGLEVVAYGSYYRLGESEPSEFPAVVATARALGAPGIRVWAGATGFDRAGADYLAAVQDDGRRCARLATQAGLFLFLEFHEGTLNDSPEGHERFFQGMEAEVWGTLWQPLNRAPAEDSLAALRVAAPRLANLHVFHWCFPDQKTIERRPLSEGKSVWRRYLAEVARLPGERFALLEFVRNDAPAQLAEDAATLHEWLAEAGN